MSRRIQLITLIMVLFMAWSAPSEASGHKVDTLYLSADYTTHVIFSTDITYADLSNSRVVAARIIEQNRNMMALKAKLPFTETTSVSALESNGDMHTFIVCYSQSPKDLVIDCRPAEGKSPMYQAPVAEMIDSGHGRKSRYEPYQPEGANVSTWKPGRTPELKDVAQYEQKLYHLSDKEYDILVLCEDISCHSDVTFITLSLRNSSGISYAIGDASFVIESKKKSRRSVHYEKTVMPRSRYGTLATGPGGYSRMVYSFPKMTLAKDQVLNIYFYEQGGQRNLNLRLDSRDINKARRTSM